MLYWHVLLPSEGRSVWTMQLLADELVALNVVDTLSDETVRRTLKKMKLKPWNKKSWLIPPLANAEYVKCMDESNKQHIEETKIPIPMKHGEPSKHDYEYKRNGVSVGKSDEK